MKCKNCGALLEQDDRTEYWIHLITGKFRCDGGWYMPTCSPETQAQPDLFGTYLEELISAPAVIGKEDHYHEETKDE